MFALKFVAFNISFFYYRDDLNCILRNKDNIELWWNGDEIKIRLSITNLSVVFGIC